MISFSLVTLSDANQKFWKGRILTFKNLAGRNGDPVP